MAPPRIAVVGSGLAGLHVAWALSCAEHYPPGHPLNANPPEVHLYERADTIGFDAASVDVFGGRARVDVPMRGFYVSYYPRLAALYRATGVQFARRCVGGPPPCADSRSPRPHADPRGDAPRHGRRGWGQGSHHWVLPKPDVAPLCWRVVHLSIQHTRAARCVPCRPRRGPRRPVPACC